MSQPVFGLAILLVSLAFAILGLMPVIPINGPPSPGLPWADHGQPIEMHPVLRLTDDGLIVVSGRVVGRLDQPDGWDLSSMRRDLPVQQTVDTINLQIPPSARMSAVNAIIRAAEAGGVKRFDLVVETWARY